MDKMIINKILSVAKEKGVSQSHICNQLGLRRSYLVDVRNGKDRITPDRLEKIASILHTTPEYLRDETDDPNEKTSEQQELSPTAQRLIETKFSD